MSGDSDVTHLAETIVEADPQIRLRVGVVTAIESSGSRRVQTDQTDTGWLSCDKDSTYQIGDRVWMIQQGGVFVVAGRLSGEPAGCPIGTILAYAGSTPPPGWLAANGQAISRTTYAKLFAATGTGYGVGNGTTTFNVPNLENRFPLGAGSSFFQTTTGGAATVALSTGNLPAHDHGSGGGHSHALADINAAFVTSGGGVGALVSSPGNNWVTTTNGAHTHTSVGSGTAHENMPPYLAILYIIRAL